MKVTVGQKFRKEINEIVEKTGEPYIDVIMDYCQRHKLEVETVAKLCRGEMKEKLEEEAREKNLLKD